MSVKHNFKGQPMKVVKPNSLISPKFKPLEIRKSFNYEIEKLAEDLTDSIASKDVLSVKPANQWIEEAKIRPNPKQLFGPLWHQNEICILFADTNLGKSILAVQIANSISSGKAINGINLQIEAAPVLYFDFELSDKQFENRYSEDYDNHFKFHKNLLRVEINPDAELPKNKTFDDCILESIEKNIISYNSKILIIDNITYLRAETEKAKDALPLMKRLKALKSKYNLSLLILAHTPKRDLSKPICKNDLQGSKMLINFCDSAFAIGESQNDTSLRYIKQIKERNTEKVYHSENVLICEIEKPNNFLQFRLLDTGFESEHLKQYGSKEKKDKMLEAQSLKSQGMNNVQIGQKLGVHESTIRKWFKKLTNEK